MIRFVTLAALLLAVASCSGRDDSMVAATLSIPVPQTNQHALETDSLTDEHGLYNLQSFPVFVMLRVSADDIEPAEALWPEEPADLAQVVGDEDVEVDFELEVDSGSARKVEVVAFLFYNNIPTCFLPENEHIVDLASGATHDLEIVLAPVPAGKISGAAGLETAEVWLVDLDTMVRLSRVVPTNKEYEFLSAPCNRTLAIATLDSQGAFSFDETDTFILNEEDLPYRFDLD